MNGTKGQPDPLGPLILPNARLASLGHDGDDAEFLAWVSCQPSGQVLHVAALSDNGPGHGDLIASAGSILSVHLACDDQGRLIVVWNQIEPQGAKLYWSSRSRRGGWTPPAPVAALFGTQLSPSLARDVYGRVWLAMSSNSIGCHQIFLAWLAGGQWSFPLRISDGDGHCFAPALCRFGRGVRVVWDGRIDGRFGVFMREFDTGHKVGRYEPQASVAESATALLADPSIIALDSETSLVAYEAAQAGWGAPENPHRAARLAKTERHFLHAQRELRAVVIGPSGMAPLQSNLTAALAKLPSHTRTQPRLARSADGTIWLTYRQDELPTDGQTDGKPPVRFVQAVSHLGPTGWAEPSILPDSCGTSRMCVAFGDSPDGPMRLAYTSRQKGHAAVHVVPLPAAPASRVRTGRFQAMPITSTSKPRRIKPTTLDGQFGSARLLFGDVHRHSDLSACHRWVEGSSFDAYRHALTVGQLDFFAVTDHAWYLATPDNRAELHPLADAFNLPGRFTAFRGYEANFDPGQGHMVILGDDEPLTVMQPKTRRQLLRKLDPAHVVAIPHHPGDPDHYYRWDGHNDTVGPVAELYQPYRTAFESAAAPAPLTPWRLKLDQTRDKSIRDECTLLAAWRAGHKLGVIASSDHLSTAGAFACVWAERNTRDGILDALRRRHCYAASAKIELAFWADEHFMGDVATQPSGPQVRFRVRVCGTAVLRKVELLTDGEVVHTWRPSRADKRTNDRLRATLRLPAAEGEHFHYIRVTQADGNMAWSSPIWLTAHAT